jgi:hypothetical protein
MERISSAAAVALGFFVVNTAASLPAAAASCDISHAPAVPVVKNLPYKEARAAILDGGWTPVKGSPHNDLSDNEITFRDRGYAELQFCRLSDDGLCRFAFASSGGFVLWVTTVGDENPPLDTQAKVKSARIACKGDADPG